MMSMLSPVDKHRC